MRLVHYMMTFIAITGFATHAMAEKATLRAYVGTYTGGESKGIYAFELDANGKPSEARPVAEIKSPSFVAIHPNQQYLYAVSEVGSVNDVPGGGVYAFAIESTGTLRALNHQSSKGAAPCHLVVDKAGKNVLVANYAGGNTVVLPVNNDGSLRAASCVIQHEGSSVNRQRQDGPHAHSINLDAANRFAFAADLGIDKMLVFRFDGEAGQLSANDPPSTSLEPGSGPRHFVFHPNGNYAYVISELLQTVTAFSYDAALGKLATLQTISTVPHPVKGNSTAEIRVHPSGKFLYGSNRGHDSIAMFSIDQRTGKLTVIGHQSTGGRTPRNFNIDPTGRFLLAENQSSSTIVIFRIDEKTGKLTATGDVVSVPSPVCVRFLEL